MNKPCITCGEQPAEDNEVRCLVCAAIFEQQRSQRVLRRLRRLREEEFTETSKL